MELAVESSLGPEMPTLFQGPIKRSCQTPTNLYDCLGLSHAGPLLLGCWLGLSIWRPFGLEVLKGREGMWSGNEDHIPSHSFPISPHPGHGPFLHVCKASTSMLAALIQFLSLRQKAGIHCKKPGSLGRSMVRSCRCRLLRAEMRNGSHRKVRPQPLAC